MSAKQRSLVLKIGGAMLVGLGLLHLAVTPLIGRFIEQNVIAAEIEWFRPPMLLNHVVVGILLLPLGILTSYAASPAVLGERWALVVVRTSAISVALLPVMLFLLMGNHYFGAAPFVAATVIVSVASVVLLVSAFWPNKSHAAQRVAQGD
jgi:hypothetical protein